MAITVKVNVYKANRMAVCHTVALDTYTVLVLSRMTFDSTLIAMRCVGTARLSLSLVRHFMDMFRSSAIIVWSTLLQPSPALRFYCDGEFTCNIWNWNPRDEGTFVLDHIPKTHGSLELHNLLLSSTSSKLFQIFEATRKSEDASLTMKMSAVRNFVLEDGATLTSLTFDRTHLSTISFGLAPISTVEIVLPVNKMSSGCTSIFVTVCLLLWSTVVPPSAALRFRCDPDYTCEIWNWNPRVEGTFVLHHIPKTHGMLQLYNLLISSASSKLFEAFETLRQRFKLTLRVTASALRNFVPEDYARYKSVEFEKTHLSTFSFGRNCSLLQLRIKRSQFSHLPKTIGRLNALQELTFSHSLIQAINLNVIAELSNLTFLDLSRNRIHSLYFTGDKVLIPNLVDVYLRENRLRSINMNLFGTMESLEKIDLSHNLISVISGSLASSRLTLLDLSFNQLHTLDCCKWSIPNVYNLEANAINSIRMKCFGSANLPCSKH
ncbi:uncharacterized protein LOC118513675 [Anopheles stephensi]|uniref:uncharacterized protein LOC118513675 n=1 Tax=Anopheles stephensi TaxID=30069 RepID=UPI001658AB76|nr:uncharacterized protein LOC118513675 [Anopheles stephensi]